MKNGMKPCPFCGNKDINIYMLWSKKDILTPNVCYRYEFVCKGCMMVKPIGVIAKNEEECRNFAVKKWNERI